MTGSLKLADLRQFFFLGFDLDGAPEGAHENIIKDIETKYKDNCRWILDTTWIFSRFGYTSDILYESIEKIIKKHITKSTKYYLVVWKLNSRECRGTLRRSDTNWVKRKLGIP